MHYDTDLQYIQIGETHTMAVANSGKIYSWGWNDFNQLGVPQSRFLFPEDSESKKNTNSFINTPLSIKNPRIITTGDNHTYLLDYDNNLYFWGSNETILFNDSKTKKNQTPMILNLFPERKAIKNIISKGNQTIFLLENGECFINLDNSASLFNPFNKIQISSVCCSYHFIIFMGKSGLLYSSGSNNSEGELGHGDRLARNEPTIIKDLGKEKVLNVECGYKHVIAKTAANKIFVWGWGKRGQLGLGSLKSECSPAQINLGGYSNHGKIVQIQAGYSSTLIMFENRRIFWWGTNNTLYKQKNPIEVVFQEKVNFFSHK